MRAAGGIGGPRETRRWGLIFGWLLSVGVGFLGRDLFFPPPIALLFFLFSAHENIFTPHCTIVRLGAATLACPTVSNTREGTCTVTVHLPDD